MNFWMAKRLGRNLVYPLRFGPKSEHLSSKNDHFLLWKSGFGPTQIASKHAYLLPKLALTCWAKFGQYMSIYDRMYLGRNMTSNALEIAKSRKTHIFVVFLSISQKVKFWPTPLVQCVCVVDGFWTSFGPYYMGRNIILTHKSLILTWAEIKSAKNHDF